MLGLLDYPLRRLLQTRLDVLVLPVGDQLVRPRLCDGGPR